VSEGSSAAAASNIDTRRVGDAVVSVVSEGELNWDPRFPASEEEARQAIPEADDEGRIWIGLNDVFIRLGDAVIAIDPGLDDPDSSWQRDRPRVWPHMPVTRTAGLAAAMAQLGIAPEEVTHVVITHPHGDHYAGVTCEPDGEMTVRFPRARHVMGRADWEGNAHRGEPETDLERLELVDRLGLLDLVDDRLEIAPGVTVLAAPGESPGHCIVRLESAGEVCYFLGDVVHHACEIDHPGWAPPHADLATLLPTRRRVFADVARDNALVVTTHERFPPWGRIIAAGDGYRWQRG